MRTLLLASLAVVLLTAAPASAVIGGEPDGDAHPYVGLVWNGISGPGSSICSGSLISPTVYITAAHCFEQRGQVVGVTVDRQAGPGASFTPGFFLPDPAFCMGCAPGLPNFDTHDVAVVQLWAPIVVDRYAQLPSVGLSDRLDRKASLTVVGYGVQGFVNGPGGRMPFSNFERTTATVSLNPGNFAWRDEFLRISANKAAICLGDSGGPNLVGDTIVAINAYANQNCTGNTYSYRLDTPAALGFVANP